MDWTALRGRLDRPGQRGLRVLRVRLDRPALPGLRGRLGLLALTVLRALRVRLLRQYMHNTEIAVTMRLSTILKTIKQPL